MNLYDNDYDLYDNNTLYLCLYDWINKRSTFDSLLHSLL